MNMSNICMWDRIYEYVHQAEISIKRIVSNKENMILKYPKP